VGIEFSEDVAGEREGEGGNNEELVEIQYAEI
jgi:hypothetical protein